MLRIVSAPASSEPAPCSDDVRAPRCEESLLPTVPTSRHTNNQVGFHTRTAAGSETTISRSNCLLVARTPRHATPPDPESRPRHAATVGQAAAGPARSRAHQPIECRLLMTHGMPRDPRPDRDRPSTQQPPTNATFSGHTPRQATRVPTTKPAAHSSHHPGCTHRFEILGAENDRCTKEQAARPGKEVLRNKACSRSSPAIFRGCVVVVQTAVNSSTKNALHARLPCAS